MSVTFCLLAGALLAQGTDEVGPIQLYEVVGSATPADREEVARVVERRIKVAPMWDASGRLCVDLSDKESSFWKPAREVILRRGKLELRPVAGEEDWKAAGVTEDVARAELRTRPEEAGKVRFYPNRETPKVAWIPPVPATREGGSERTGWFIRWSDDERIVTSDFAHVRMSQDMYGMPAPSFEMLPSARAKMRRLTEKWKGSNMVIIVDDQALSAPRIESAIETNGIITGINDPDEIRELVAVLGGGMLPVELRYAGSSSSPRATDLRRDPWELDRRVFLEPAREEVREALKRTLHGGFIFIGPDGRETRDTIWDFFNDRRGSCSRDLGSSPDWKELGTDVVLVMDQFWWTGKQNRVRILSSTLWTREKDGLWVARFRQETIHR